MPRISAMHRSRFSTLIVDVPQDKIDEAGQFWSSALGSTLSTSPDEPQFTGLKGAFPDLVVALQSIDGEARIHLDIETDDLEAEVERLTGLGAVPVSRWLDCHVLRAPSGHLLCVIPVHSDPELFAAQAKTWT
jgi:hypothetical protein